MEGGDAGVQHNERRKGKHIYSTVLKRIGQSYYHRQKKVYHSALLAGREGEVGPLGKEIIPGKKTQQNHSISIYIIQFILPYKEILDNDMLTRFAGNTMKHIRLSLGNSNNFKETSQKCFSELLKPWL